MRIPVFDLTVAGPVGLLLARLPGADAVPLVLDGVDLHPDASALLHATVAALVAFVLVHDALALEPETQRGSGIEIIEVLLRDRSFHQCSGFIVTTSMQKVYAQLARFTRN